LGFLKYWGLKSYELSKSEAEKKAMKGEPLRCPEEKHSLRMKALADHLRQFRANSERCARTALTTA
jgi:hypothetical protein